MQLYTNIEQLLRNEMQNFPQVISELLLLENVMYGLLLLQSTAGSSPRESRKGKTERQTTEERQDMTNVNNGLPCQVINSKLLRYQSISQIYGREGNSYSGDVYIPPKSKYYIPRQTRDLAGNEATWKSTGA